MAHGNLGVCNVYCQNVDMVKWIGLPICTEYYSHHSPTAHSSLIKWWCGTVIQPSISMGKGPDFNASSVNSLFVVSCFLAHQFILSIQKVRTQRQLGTF